MMQEHGGGGKLDIGGMIMHHTADSHVIEFDYYFGVLHWDLKQTFGEWHLFGLDVTPTKHVIYMLLAALIVILLMVSAGKALARQRERGQPPKGFAGAMEALVLWVRNDICVANIGRDGARFAPLILTLFFFILTCNLMGLLPWGASPTGNLAVTGGLAILVFLTIEIAGFLKLGPKGYLGTIFPHFPGIHGPPAVALAIGMAPIEVLGKLVKPFALAVRLFGNMTAGHFVVLSLFGVVFMFGHLRFANVGIGVVTATLVTGIMLLELIVAFLQAYVFALLSAVFIGLMQEAH